MNQNNIYVYLDTEWTYTIRLSIKMDCEPSYDPVTNHAGYTPSIFGEEVMKWCENNLGIIERSSYDKLGWDDIFIKPIAITYVLKSKEDAMLFKLTWGIGLLNKYDYAIENLC